MIASRGIRIVKQIVRREHGQDLMEYALLMSLIAIIAMAGVKTLGETVYNVFWNAIANRF
jgi:Flp pilus assembly pilin Flp